MTLSEQTEKRVYERLRAFDGLEVAGHEPVDSSIASVLSEGEVLADDGNQYSSIQDAVDASDSWTFVGPGTYYENVVIDKDDFTLQGAGYDTLIDGGDVKEALEVSNGVNNTMLKHFKLRNANKGSGSNAFAFRGDGIVSNVVIEHNDGTTFFDDGHQIIDSVTIESAVNNLSAGNNAIITNCTFQSGMSGRAIVADSDCIIANNQVDSVGSDGIRFWDDNVVIGNRIHNVGGNGVLAEGADTIIANNRISNSTSSDVQNNGTGTVTDANLTGAAN